MIYLLLAVSLTANGLLLWYIRKLLQKYWFDRDAREKFTNMLEQYAESLNSLYKLEELYGEEIIKKAILQTQFVIEACGEFREAIDSEVTTTQGEDSEEDESNTLDEDSAEIDKTKKVEEIIRLREGEKVTQSASTYKRVVAER